MDFELVLTTLLEQFHAQGIRYGVIGGFALGLLGIPRATMDYELFDLGQEAKELRRRYGQAGQP